MTDEQFKALWDLCNKSMAVIFIAIIVCTIILLIATVGCK